MYLQKNGILLSRDVGIISFYSGQVNRIKLELQKAKLLDQIKAQTVYGFQGGEKEVIIISFARANKARSIGFLEDFRRLNVAVTHAKKALIMVGHQETLSRNEGHLGSMLKHLMANNNIHSCETIIPLLCSKQ